MGRGGVLSPVEPAVAIVVAAGAGARMGLGVPKAFIELAGRPMVAWSVDALAASPGVGRVIVVVPPDGRDAARVALGHTADAVTLVPGGASRAESVWAGVQEAGPTADVILVHDAARPLITPAMVERVLDAVREGVAGGFAGAVAAAPVADTLKAADADGGIAVTVDRAGLWAAQTPQAFRGVAMRGAFREAAGAGTLARATDCASVLEAAGVPVRLVTSGAPNLKVTTPDDRVLAEALLRAAGRVHVD